ncbi:MAG: DUF962 domain-containing protein [Algicola sp.]|nr:DUF962 domain-containing protein [Algicola sp.]
MAREYTSFKEFWPFYLSQHSKPLTRKLHLTGVLLLFPMLYLALFYSPYLFLAMPLVGYGFSWVGHFGIEKNRPATFTYPLWSFRGDFKMCYLMLTGKMDDELSRL